MQVRERSAGWLLSCVLGLAVLVAGCSTAQEARVASPTPTPTAAPTATPTPTAEPGRPERPERPERPNLLVVEADDMRADDLRWMPRTRRLLGGTGLTFLNSFVPDPLCCPARASFLTGRHSHNHGVLTHEVPYGFSAFDDRRTLATALSDGGYRTALVGKYLNGYGVEPTRDGGDSSAYVPPGWSQWYASVDASALFGGGTYDYFRLTSNVNGVQRSWPGEYTTEVTSRQVQQVLRRFERGPGRRPWFVWWTPVAPHHGDPVEPGDPTYLPEADGELAAWATPARPDRVRGRFDRRIPHAPGVTARGRSEPDVSDKPAYVRRATEPTADELAALTALARQRAEALHVLDVEVAETLRTLRRTGAAAETVVAFTSDNGFYLGEHRRRQGKVTLHEPSVRVPLLLAGPGVPHGRRFDPVTTLDLTATLARLARVGLARPDGRDLWPLVAGGDRGWRRTVLLEARMLSDQYAFAADAPGWRPRGISTSGIRLGRYKLVRYATGEVELYDLRADPLELHGVAADRPALVARLTALWRRYAECAGASCSRPVPPRWRLTPEENRRLTLRQQRAADARAQ